MRPGDEVAGRYRLEELKGRGPMSEVWRAHDGTLDRTVALKLLSPIADLGRFRREAQALAALGHENVMRVYDYGEDEAGPFMALEWLPGGTLSDRLSSGPLSSRETHRIAVEIAAGLAHLHARGLIHRDLKPANILFDEEGRAKLGDFGLVRHTAGSGTLTEAGTVLGTAAYISPEQAAGEPAGAASDVYSFGVILFQLLTGALPFTADDALALVNMHRHAPPPAIESLRADAPPGLAALTAAALRKNPAQRPADGSALLDALGSAPVYSTADDTQVTRVFPGQARSPAKRSRRAWPAAAGAIVLLATGGGVLAWGVTRTGGNPVGGDSASHPITGTHTPGGATGTAATSIGSTGSDGQRGGRRHKPATTTGQTTTPATTAQVPTTTVPPTIPTTPPTTTVPQTTTVPTTVPATTTSGVGTTTTTATT